MLVGVAFAGLLARKFMHAEMMEQVYHVEKELNPNKKGLKVKKGSGDVDE